MTHDDAHRARGLDLEQFAQSLREAHCARGDAAHPCVGACTITATGVDLDCRLCGSGSEPLVPADTLPEGKLARAVVRAAGVEWDALSPAAQRRACDAARKTGR